ncbi:antA/AntB antirepressor family protein [Acinetobacter junii]|uniref:antA/AntB antirepressor family protein n=1 Tax=Acinetobacter junii TaxID=40215 RepID=UPI00124BE8A1|nr:antA/AntB antirepressor family protein [Acinetobacter junii]
MNMPMQFSNVNLGDEGQLGVNARDVYKTLEVKADFSHWIKRRIKQGGFEENQDYILVVKKDEQVSGAKFLHEYIVSLDMAKHLGMMEKNAKGREIRKYFIEHEKQSRNMNQSLQIEIGKFMQQVEQFKNSLSDAGRLLCVGGKQIMPKMLNELDSMVQKAQHKLDFNDGN